MPITLTYDIDDKAIIHADFGERRREMTQFVKNRITEFARDKASDSYEMDPHQTEAIIAFPNSAGKIYDLHVVFKGATTPEKDTTIDSGKETNETPTASLPAIHTVIKELSDSLDALHEKVVDMDKSVTQVKNGLETLEIAFTHWRASSRP